MIGALLVGLALLTIEEVVMHALRTSPEELSVRRTRRTVRIARALGLRMA